MFSHAYPARLRPHAWFAVLIGALMASFVATGEAQAGPSPAIQTAPFVSDRLSVEVIGAGPDVILIPGLASSREVWRPLATRLAATHRVHLVQPAGFAGAPWTHGDGAFVAPEVEALARYVAEAGLDHPAVIGHSMGGLSGLLLAQAHPDLVGRLMIVDALPFYSAMFGPAVTAAQARPFAAQASAMILSADDAAFRTQQVQTAAGLARDPDMREKIVAWSMATDRRAFAAAMTDVMTTDARPGLAAMSLPVTALYATDPEGGPPPAMAQALWEREYAALPGAKVIRVDASRHFIMADQPARFDALVDEFLR